MLCELSQHHCAQQLLRSLNPIHIGGVRICLTDCLTECYFHRVVCKEKNIWRNSTVSQDFRPVAKIGPQPRKTSVLVSVSSFADSVLNSVLDLTFLLTPQKLNLHMFRYIVLFNANLKSKFFAKVLFIVFNGMIF